MPVHTVDEPGRALTFSGFAAANAGFLYDTDNTSTLDVALWLRPSSGSGQVGKIALYRVPQSGIHAHVDHQRWALAEYGLQARTPTPRGPPVDLDGDGVPEIVGVMDRLAEATVPGAAWPVPVDGETVYITDPAWTFLVAGWHQWRWVADLGVADLDLDGHPDLLLAGDYAGTTRKLVVARGPFEPGDHLLEPPWLASATIDNGIALPTVDDWNGDGWPDLGFPLVTGDTQGEFAIHLGPVSEDLLQDAPDIVISSTTPHVGSTLSLLPGGSPGDLDGDGAADFVFTAGRGVDPHVDGGVAFVFRGPLQAGARLRDSDAWATIRWHHSFGYLDVGVPLGDIDGDGRADLAVAAWGARGDLAPAGLFDPDLSDPSATAQTYPFGIAEGMVLVFTDLRGGELGPEDAALVLRGHSAGAIAGFSGMMSPGDFDGDGLGDLAVATYAPDEALTWWFISPCNDFGTPVTSP